LPTYEDSHEDSDDRKALGKNNETIYVTAEDLDDEDEELDDFEAMEVEEKLRRLVMYLREEHRYCLWCKCAYDDDDMEGCPGVMEADHD
jgi:hypothetical protein